ncbi:DUF917 domain-containing protein [Lactobacillus xylocopicola]|uniref:DUF917 domain-containing protein n=1 Tax=Lactobacillus xylocopicola TaxID=2976676 RepID=A0ABN6SMR9_9LACO|nr:DUF917 domain-containing protein [Lactobacillus xylocopicola]BDR61038.1 hypothetical protein KIM322_12990 [Lactobacillus xylocopicola]
MSRQITIKDVKQIAIGAALLGSGGGGNPFIGELMAISAIKKHGPVTLLTPDEFPDDEIFVSASNIGAPAVSMEKFPNGNEFINAFEIFEQYYNKKIYGTFPIEAGGINSMMPLVAAAKMGLPIADADGMGRAFPELQMSTFVLAGHSVTPMVLSDERGNTSLLNTPDSFWAERIGRDFTVQVGATSSSASDPVTGKELRSAGVLNIISLSQNIGQLIQHTNDYVSVNSALTALLKLTHGYKLMTAKIVDISHTTSGGFNFGEIILSGLNENEGQTGKISFQNENIIMQLDEQILATVPDLITMVDMDTLQPITNEEVRYGKRIMVLGLPANEKWRTAAGISLVGPRYFKYDVDYIPIEQRYAEYQNQ